MHTENENHVFARSKATWQTVLFVISEAADCHNQCAHWFRNDVGWEGFFGGSKQPPYIGLQQWREGFILLIKIFLVFYKNLCYTDNAKLT